MKRQRVVGLLDQAAVSVGNFLVLVLVARGLSVADFGQYSLIWLVLLLAAGLQMAVIVSPMNSLVYEDGKPPVMTLAVLQLWFVGIVMVAGFLAAAIATAWTVLPALAALAAPVVLGCALLKDFYRRLHYRLARPASALVSDLFATLVTLTLLWLLLRGERLSIPSALAGVALGASAGLVVDWLLLRHAAREAWSRMRLSDVLSRHWRFGRWQGGSATIYWLTTSGVTAFLGAAVGAAEVGGVRAAQAIAGVSQIALQSVENYLPMQATRTYSHGGYLSLRGYITRQMIIGGALVAMLVTPMALFSGPLLSLVFGSAYAPYDFVLVAAAAGTVLTFLAMPLQAGLRALQQTRELFLVYAIISLVGVPTAMLLIGWFGLSGYVIYAVGLPMIVALGYGARFLRADGRS